MCKKHVPIVVYEAGGTQKYCEKCGVVLTKWEPNIEKPKEKPKKENK